MATTEQNNRDRHYFEQLLKRAEDESRSRAAEKDKSLLSEDPLGINYARWATEEEMKESLREIPKDTETAESSGVPMLCTDGAVYVDDSDSHTLILGASGSKKTRLFILPTILTLMKAGESMIVTDPKAELFERTSGRLRENGYEVLCINFRDDSRQNCWNPLKAPREFYANGKFDLAVGLLNDFSSIAVPKDGRGGDPFWDDSSRSAFMGMLLLMFLLAEDPEEINIRGLLRMRNYLFDTTDVKNSPMHKLYKLIDPGSLAASYLSTIAIAPERTLGSILATLDTHLIKFIMRPDLTDMLCHDDLDFHALGHKKTAVFLVMPDEKETYHGLISIFIQQCYESLIFEAQKLPNKTLPRRVNFLLDEFSSLPPIKEFPAMIAAARSRNIRFNIVVQSEKQLRSRYGDEAETIKGNCNNWLFLYSRELETLEAICRLCGNQKSGNPLITPSRLQRLDKQKGEVLVIHGRNYPFLSRLDDVNEYDHEQFLPVYCKAAKEEELRILKVDQLMKEHSSEWLEARLAQNTVKQAKAEAEERARAEEERKKKEAEEAAILAEKIKAAKKMAYIDWLLVQKQSLKDDKILKASKEWYEKTYPFQPADLFGHVCNVTELSEEKKEQVENILLPAGAFPLNYISVIAEMNRENVAIYGEDGEILSAAAHHVYRRALASGQMVPIYFSMEDMVTDWNALIQRYAKEELTILPLLMAKNLFDLELPEMPEIPEGAEVKKLELPDFLEETKNAVKWMMQEFSQKPEGMPRYLVILDRLDLAPYAMDAIWQSCFLAEFPNVRVFATTTQRVLLNDNCCNYFNRAKADSPLDRKAAKNYIFGSRTVLYFDEKTNEVKVKQGEGPAIQLEVVSCYQS